MTNPLPARDVTKESTEKSGAATPTRVTAARRYAPPRIVIPANESSLLQKEEDCCSRATD
ncbi:MAG: hypothetical protein PW788_03855 [Micavibrio sp.]|nr:hypothetical protein [Micavibrio sp.]